nr:reverse transcriptase domain-containing protein [Tanacetum cinerariifolium]
DQPLLADASPTALSPGYVVDSNPEKDEKDPKEDPVYYPANRGKDDDNESSNDDENDDDIEKDEEDKEEEEHLAPADPSDCKLHYSGPCTVKCGNCKKVGHIIQNCGTPATAKNQRTRTCYECGSLRHYKSECQIVKFHKCMDMIHGRMRASKKMTIKMQLKLQPN